VILEVAVPAAYWGTWLIGLVLAGFLIPEGIAIKDKQGGDTLSENVKRWFHTDTPGGGWTFAGTWLTAAGAWVWFLGHILGWWH
jgi:hypothetical protein